MLPVFAMFVSSVKYDGDFKLPDSWNGFISQFDEFPVAMSGGISVPNELIEESQITYPGDRANLLMPISNHLNSLKNHAVKLMSVHFYALNLTSIGQRAGTTIITADQANGAIESSLNSPNYSNNCYNQGRARLTPLPGWQPNFFRPRLALNSMDYFEGLGSASSETGNTANRGALGVGLKLPYEEMAVSEDHPLVYITNLTSIEVYARALQQIEVEVNNESYVRYQNYPVICELKFLKAD